LGMIKTDWGATLSGAFEEVAEAFEFVLDCG
jgi:hypothetical protein